VSVQTELILTNARLVLADRVVTGSVQIRDGVITAVDEGAAHPAGAEDLEGDLLLPGLVELHTDNLERHLLPRPGVVWPAYPALLTHDAQVAASGMTTVLDALCVGHGSRRDWREVLAQAVPALHAARGQDHLRADHLLHLRCELIDPELPDLFETHSADPLVRLVSVMDHTPGQRQFADLGQYRKFMGGLGMSEAEMDQAIAQGRELRDRYSDRHRATLVARCRELGLPVASHDDETESHVADAAALGIALSEFPTTHAAAAAARRHRLRSVMGAPNIVRGGSHSGNVSAMALARAGLLDILSSDYVPASLLHAAFLMAAEGAMTLPEAVACVTRTPARAIGLDDRGEIARGLRADLVRVAEAAAAPVVRAVWRGGLRVV
jgi:alpha-D-ribose 1-methylphosphonate 5-triphosphate diphosphatase